MPRQRKIRGPGEGRPRRRTVHRYLGYTWQSARESAEANGGLAAVATFDPHPARVLPPTSSPRLITSTPHKLKLLEGLGIEIVLVIPFDREFSETEAEDFVREFFAA